MKQTEIIEALQWRYAVKTFDSTKKISDEDLSTILESGRLAPSSFGIEPWKFVVVNNPELRQQLRAAAYDQTKVTDASHIIMIAVRTDAEALPAELIARTAAIQGKSVEELAAFEQMVTGAVTGKPEDVRTAWLRNQTYIPLGVMVETASLLGIDNCAMEGFDPAKVSEILGLGAKNLKAVTMLALGYRGEDSYATLPKVRRTHDEVVEVLN